MRSIVLRLITQLPYRVRLRLLAGPNPLSSMLGAIWRWAARAPLAIRGGAAAGLVLDAGFDPGHVQAGELAAGTVEPEVQRALAQHLEADGVLFDVGANVGFFSMLGARLVGQGGAVHAFDPLAENVQVIRASAARNAFESVVVHQVGVAADEGSRTLLVAGDASWARLDAPSGRHGVVSERQVDTVTLDALVAKGAVPAPTVVKIDVEGGEEDVVRGMTRTLESHRPVLVIEMHPPHADGVPALLAEHGYDLRPLGDDPLSRRDAPVHAVALARA